MSYKDTIEVEVHFDELDETQLKEYALQHLEVVDPEKIEIDDYFTENEVERYLRNFGFLPAVNKSLRYMDAYTKLVKNSNKIPIEEIENLLTKYNCI